MLKQFLPGYTHQQPMPNTVWTVAHNLNRAVMVDVFVNFQGKLEKILPRNVVILDLNTVRVEFSTPMTGKVRVL